ncbi:hypothetical protein PLESTB_000527000 [Pleodorina starrii]|uniref:Pseudouridine synthase RsuA/RluA-like domain-containing protein n=1 Tax=Pleodorina starrii TaxID=330485 RepID=A0A9W6BH35_9CHLO|nr:hypothetical protein PLESTM_000390400 [Pleodorina starrii]GLC51668.1 hypothetical protein PLESTB_000527000 [Pleodorina starrii]
MRRCIPQSWLQLVATAPGEGLAGGSGWWAVLAQHGSWRGLSGRAKVAEPLAPPDRSVQPTKQSSTQGAGTPRHAAAPAANDPQQAAHSVAVFERFLENFEATPPASFLRSVGVPTALSWMRRRGPEVPHAVLYRLFRQRQIRLFDGHKIRRVSPSRPLENGDLLLYPKWLKPDHSSKDARQRKKQSQLDPAARAAAALAAADTVRRSHGEGEGDDADAGAGVAGDGAGTDELWDGRPVSHAAAGPGPGSSAATAAVTAAGAAAAAAGRRGQSLKQHHHQQQQQQQQGLVLSPERVRRWVLGVHPGLLFLNKPAGVRVHGRAAGDETRGGGGMRPPAPQTLNDVMRQALRFGEGDEPRLVHRLDQAASGVMVVARNADAATWLCAAFRDKAEQALAGGRRGDGGRRDGDGDDGGVDDPWVGRTSRADEPPSIRRTYWAFLAGDLQPRQSGYIRIPVVVDGVACPAVTSYRVRATGCGVTWVELTPETGRRHQLRVHCARKLGAPIIGDERYGYRGLPPRLALRDRLPPEWWALLGEDPRVMRRSVAAAGAAEPLPPPVLLHSRELLVRRPGRATLSAVAPLPRYIRELIQAAGWQAPAVG